MKNNILIFSLVLLSSCNEVEKLAAEKGSLFAPDSSTICSGTTILNVAGTANCSGGGSDSGPIQMLSFASRKDNASFPVTALEFDAFFAAPDRVVATLQDEAEENLVFTDNHSIIPNPLADSDGRYAPCLYKGGWSCDYSDVLEYPVKRHYLETIAVNDPLITARANIVVCGTSGTIEARIANCATLNGLWAFYDGTKYGQDGEGDWKLVSVVGAGPKYEVWRDERTKLLWSDKASANYNWYQAAGYSKASADSIRETQFTSQPGVLENSAPLNLSKTLQPASPISVCPDVDGGGEIAAGGGTPTYTYVNPETDFKAGLSYPQSTWRLPSINDWKLADVNGIRKVLPNMDYVFWSASSYSYNRHHVWLFGGAGGSLSYNSRGNTPSYSVRCVASSRD
jgi:hypothetical protein